MNENVPEAIQQAKDRIKTYKDNRQQELNLSGLGLTEADLRELMPLINPLGNLKILDLSDIPLSSTVADELDLKSLFGTLKVNISYGENYNYTGDMRWGSFNGQGAYRNANGNSHEGKFVRGKPQGIGRSQYSSGEVLEGTFHNGKLVFNDLEHQLKPNTVPTLVARSQRMLEEKRTTKYEIDKHKAGGLPDKVVIVANGSALLDATRAFLKEHTGTKTFRLVVNQHSGHMVNPDIKISEKDAEAILQLLVDKGIEDIRISSHSCNLTEAKLFMDLAPDFTQQAQVTVLTVPDGKNAFEGLKINKNGEKKFTSFYVTDAGEYALREKFVFKKQQRQATKTNESKETIQKDAFSIPLNLEKASLTSTKNRKTPELRQRPKMISPKH